MDELTGQVGLTRGALYHHFGDKKGLLQAVIDQIDEEMTVRLTAISEAAANAWDGFIDESIAYMNMAREPEIQRIMFLDGPAVLGDPSQWQSQIACIRNTQRSIAKLINEGRVRDIDAMAAGRLVMGALLGASLWIAHTEDPQSASEKSEECFRALASGLLKEGGGPSP